ncbi:MAG: alpha-galactosidase [Ignavibacteriaceae bacterium]
MISKFSISFIILFTLLNTGLSYSQKSLRFNGENISIEYDSQLKSRIISRINNNEILLGDFSSSEFMFNGLEVTDNFKYTGHTEDEISGKTGKGKKIVITGTSGNLKKIVSVISYKEFPAMLFFNIVYENTGNKELNFTGWVNNQYYISPDKEVKDSTVFWSYQPGSYGWDNDWIQQLGIGYKRDNYLGMNNVDYGGGTPIADVWRKDVGLAVGHVEMVPKLISLPTSVNENSTAEISVKYEKPIIIKPGETYTTFTTFVSVHTGDYFSTLTSYSRFMEAQGIEFKKIPEDAYGTEWCGWGYEKDFTMEKFYGTFPVIKKLGFDWITLDYGWESAVGDYYLPEDKFPNGDADMKKVVDSIHAAGAKARLWWMPLSVYPKTDMFTEHPEYMLLNEDQSPVFIQFWKSFFLCPASEEVQKLTKDFVIKAIKDWGYEGLKIDGNNLNTVPPCYNPAHKHAYPEESTEKLPELYKMIYETALSINPDAVIQICPCGTNQSFHILPYMNQTVSSDPHSSWHVRIKGKTLLGLTQSKTAFAGDHVELSDNKSDFASTVGIGGVIATKFTWPVGAHLNKETGDVTLTPEKEKEWAKWIKIYNDNMLSKGLYRGELYDIGFDRPEAHAIKKDQLMYYAFFANEFSGEIELRGLENKSYTITDYENNKELGTVTGPVAKLKVNFNKHLLIKAEPK